MNSGIYLLQISNYVYVGSTKDFTKRFKYHSDSLLKGKHQNVILQRVYDKRKEEYIAKTGDPYGIFKDDPTEKNRERVKDFITMPEIETAIDG